jgi:hypothetical protein
MARVRTDFRKVAELVKKIDDDFRAELGFIVTEAIKAALDKGISPVDGVGRLAPYKNPEKYPGLNRKKTARAGRAIGPEQNIRKSALMNKRQSPVTLKLTGRMLKDLKFKVFQGRVWIGFFDTDEAVKARALNDGTSRMAARPILPTEPGQVLNQTIWRLVMQAVKQKIENLTKSEK